MLERSIQIVASEFILTTDDHAVAQRFDELRLSAVQAHPVERRYSLSVQRGPSGLHVHEDAREPMLVRDADEAAALVDSRMHELALDALQDRTKVHAGCGVWFNRRFLVVGRGGAGKTTLMTRLLMESCAVEGDELVLLHDGEAVAYPRRFGVRRLTLSLVPEVGALAPHLTGGTDGEKPGGYHVLALDPIRLQVPWRIGQGPVDVVFLLGPRCDGATRIAPCPPETVLRRLTEQSNGPIGPPGGWARDLSALMRTAVIYDLQVGDLDSAVSAVRRSLM